MKRIKVVFDMETQDPDDFLTLLLLLGHPCVDLRAVTVTPGSTAQIGIVRYALQVFDVDLPIGAYNIDHPKKCVSAWHYKVLGDVSSVNEAEEGYKVLFENCDEHTTLITGAPLKNLGKAIEETSITIGRLVAQGGFAGAPVVPEHLQMEKFKGKTTCPTFNLGGDSRSALAALEYSGILKRYFVSKNVCHRVLYDKELHVEVEKIKEKSRSLQMIWRVMEIYLRKKSSKKLHDPLAACCAIDPSIGEWSEVELYYQRGEWGSRLCPGSNTWIIINYNHQRFLRTLLAF
ncbi:nucleoside hydrolase [Candidatus Uabimicrobium sp. HlEnr_7]|uniref:nucleoside hydrolase n=1 Tax=Candidatus Uabimicrobium helgolandensis TaxID=3095367 RepID=UPI0035562A14